MLAHSSVTETVTTPAFQVRVVPPEPSTPDLSLQKWLPSRAPQSEDDAEEFVRKLKPLVLKLVRSRRPRRESEEDLVQVVFIKIFSKFDQYSGLVPLVNWVSRIAINTCLNQLAHEKARPEWRHADLPEPEADRLSWAVTDEESLSPSEEVDRKDYIQEMLGRLKPEDRMLLTLLHLQDYSLEDVSRLTGWTAGNIKVRACRARAKIREG